MIDYRDYLSSDPDIMRGKPVLKGTRITVELVLRKLAGGYGVAEVLEMYPHVSKEAVEAVIAHSSSPDCHASL